MKSVETTGKSIEEAIELGLKELNCTRDEVEVKIIDAPSKGIFGWFGIKQAKVKLNLRDKKNDTELFEITDQQSLKVSNVDKIADEEFSRTNLTDNGEQPEVIAVNFLEKIFQKLGVTVNTEVSKQEDFLHLSFHGDDLGILIGRRGETLDSLQYLTNLVVGKKCGQKYRIILDVEGYRKRREQTLVNLACRLSEKVKRTGHNIVLEPMNPHERRIIHTALQNDLKVRTFSEGEEPYRKVIITRKAR